MELAPAAYISVSPRRPGKGRGAPVGGPNGVIAAELFDKLREIEALGFVPSLRDGDTGVGYTLESLLGIAANTSRSPDYKGIELKSSRHGLGKAGRRTTLFSQIPNWKLGGIGSAIDILTEFGWHDAEADRLQFYCSVTSNPNPQGFCIEADAGADRVNNYLRGADGSQRLITQWVLSSLLASLAAKHPETFWVAAEVRTAPDGTEEFHYTSVRHTTGPLLDEFVPLVNGGKVSVDYTLSQRPTGAVRDHGYLWRINGSSHQVLFPDGVTYSLASTGD